LASYLEPTIDDKNIICNLFDQYASQDPFTLKAYIDAHSLAKIQSDKNIFNQQAVASFIGRTNFNIRQLLREVWPNLKQVFIDRVSIVRFNEGILRLIEEFSTRVDDRAFTDRCLWITFVYLDKHSSDRYADELVGRIYNSALYCII
jgi:hypothetical protein